MSFNSPPIIKFRLITAVLRGIGQIMLQENAWTGLFFILGLFYSSFLFGFSTLAGALIGTLLARRLRFPHQQITQGLYGFNGALSALVLFVFFEPSPLVILMAFMNVLLSTWLMYFFQKKIAPYTAPFVLSSWLFFYLLFFFFNDLALRNAPQLIETWHPFDSVVLGTAQVMFQDNWVTGILFLFGVFLNSWRDALWTVLASLLATLFALLLLRSMAEINLGLWSYNAILVTIALKGSPLKDFFGIIFALLISVLILFLFKTLNVIALTAPFVLATWIGLWLRSSMGFKKHG